MRLPTAPFVLKPRSLLESSVAEGGVMGGWCCVVIEIPQRWGGNIITKEIL
jgi:hypothetical protein